MLETGTKAPDFSLPDQDGVMHSLSQYRGKKLFYIFVQEITHQDVQNRPVVFVTYTLSLRKKVLSYW